MSSSALSKFKTNHLVDVNRLIATHRQLNYSGMGRRSFGHITRSGVVMLCAAWELYLEELLAESARFLLKHATKLAHLPEKVQEEIAKTVREDKHELKPLALAGEGWRDVYINHVLEIRESLNTPKGINVDRMFHRLLGIPDLSKSWFVGSPHTIDTFVAVRGDIAHRGCTTEYVKIKQLVDYKNQVFRIAIDTDNALAKFLRDHTLEGRAPWRRYTVPYFNKPSRKKRRHDLPYRTRKGRNAVVDANDPRHSSEEIADKGG